jgi:hypothetical protein
MTTPESARLTQVFCIVTALDQTRIRSGHDFSRALELLHFGTAWTGAVSGHDFSRADDNGWIQGFGPWVLDFL